MKRIKLLAPILGLTSVASLTTVLTSCKDASSQTIALTWTEGTSGIQGNLGKSDLYSIETNKQYVYSCKVSEISKDGKYKGECYIQTEDEQETMAYKFASYEIKVGNTTITPITPLIEGILYFEIPDSAKQTDILKITAKYTTAGKARTILCKFSEKQF